MKESIAKAALELLFPSNIYCICCGNIIDDSRIYGLCDYCMDSFEWTNNETCEKCGKPLQKPDSSHSKTRCNDCMEIEHVFTKGFTCFLYTSEQKDMIHKFKYNGQGYMGEKLGKLMASKISAQNVDIDIVTAVPTEKKKLKKRGYNQAEIMAKEVALSLEMPYDGKLLKRNFYSAPMNKLGAEERRFNVQSAYAINDVQTGDCKGKSILLIDDLYTTGATADTCSKLLFDRGAKHVYVLTLASGGN